MIRPKLKSAGGFTFMDSGERYRIKFRLSDGRFIYATDGNQFTTLTKEGLVADPLLEQVFKFGAYSSDLRIFTRRDMAPQPFLTIVETIPEPTDSPVDSSAFVLGGIPVSEFVAKHGNSFNAQLRITIALGWLSTISF
jgi:hypothetical protein